MNLVTKTVKLSIAPRLQEMIEELKLKFGTTSDQETLRYAVSFAHSKSFPSYAVAADTRPARVQLTAKDRLTKAKEERKAKEDFAREEYLEILEELDGVIIEKEGRELATYYNYSHKTRYLQEVSLRLMSRDLLANQYFPSREKVEKLQKDRLVDYDVTDVL